MAIEIVFKFVKMSADTCNLRLLKINCLLLWKREKKDNISVNENFMHASQRNNIQRLTTIFNTIAAKFFNSFKEITHLLFLPPSDYFYALFSFKLV